MAVPPGPDRERQPEPGHQDRADPRPASAPEHTQTDDHPGGQQPDADDPRDRERRRSPRPAPGAAPRPWNQPRSGNGSSSRSCIAISAVRPNWIRAMTMTPSGRRPSEAGAGRSVMGRANLTGGGSGPKDAQAGRDTFGGEPVRLVMIAVDLGRLRRVGGHPHGSGPEPDRPGSHVRVRIVHEHLGEADDPARPARGTDDDDLEEAVGRVDGYAAARRGRGTSWPQFASRTMSPRNSWRTPSASIRKSTGRSRAACRAAETT